MHVRADAPKRKYVYVIGDGVRGKLKEWYGEAFLLSVSSVAFSAVTFSDENKTQIWLHDTATLERFRTLTESTTRGMQLGVYLAKTADEEKCGHIIRAFQDNNKPLICLTEESTKEQFEIQVLAALLKIETPEEKAKREKYAETCLKMAMLEHLFSIVLENFWKDNASSNAAIHKIRACYASGVSRDKIGTWEEIQELGTKAHGDFFSVGRSDVVKKIYECIANNTLHSEANKEYFARELFKYYKDASTIYDPIGFLTEIISIHPHPDYYMERARLLRTSPSSKLKAIEDFKEAIKGFVERYASTNTMIRQSLISAYKDLALMYEESQDYKKALEYYLEAYKFDHGDIGTNLAMIKMYEELEDYLPALLICHKTYMTIPLFTTRDYDVWRTNLIDQIIAKKIMPPFAMLEVFAEALLNIIKLLPNEKAYSYLKQIKEDSYLALIFKTTPEAHDYLEAKFNKSSASKKGFFSGVDQQSDSTSQEDKLKRGPQHKRGSSDEEL